MTRERRHHLLVAAAMVLVVVLVDAWLRPATFSAFSFRLAREYGAAVVGSLLVWWGLAALIGRFQRGWLLGLVAVPVLFTQGAVMLAYRRLPDEEGALFFANQWRFTLKTALQSRDVRALLMLLAIAALVAAFTALSRRVRTDPKMLGAAVVGMVISSSLAVAMNLSAVMPITPDLNALRFTAKVASWGGSPPPFFAVIDRQPAAPPVGPLPFNVLWVVHETFGAKYLRTPDGRPVTGALLSLQDDPSVVWFDRLHAVSTCTDVSMPALFSGVSAVADHPAQASATLPFDLAHDAHAFTFIVSAQSLTWANQERYLGPQHFDVFRGAESFDPAADGDEGVPDELAFDEALVLGDRAAAEGRPFMGVVRTNGPHGPYRVDPADSPWTADPGFGPGETGGFVRYLNALHRLDRKFDDFWQAARGRPWFENTLVILTADHGEAFNQHGLLWHCGSFYPEETFVPGVLRLPRSWREAHPDAEAALRQRAHETTFLTELAPTVAELLSWPPLVPQFDGQSLLGPRGGSPVPLTNCSDFRACATADFGLYDQGLRWVYAGAEHRWQAFDEATDPDALHDVAGQHGGAPTAALSWLRSQERLRSVTNRLVGTE